MKQLLLDDRIDSVFEAFQSTESKRVLLQIGKDKFTDLLLSSYTVNRIIKNPSWLEFCLPVLSAVCNSAHFDVIKKCERFFMNCSSPTFCKLFVNAAEEHKGMFASHCFNELVNICAKSVQLDMVQLSALDHLDDDFMCNVGDSSTALDILYNRNKKRRL